jgi:hypothetical protein
MEKIPRLRLHLISSPPSIAARAAGDVDVQGGGRPKHSSPRNLLTRSLTEHPTVGGSRMA